MNNPSPDTTPTADPSLATVILAAGQGTRMQSDLPKVAHKVAGRPMVSWVVDAAREAGVGRIVLVVGYAQDVVRTIFETIEYDLRFVTQSEQLGTAHAVQCALPELEDFEGDVLILCGDGPLIRTETLRTLLQTHRASGAAMTLATSVVEDPSGYGRIVRTPSGAFAAIVEERVASPEQLRIREINPSLYVFKSTHLASTLSQIERNGISGEYYVTDAPAILQADGRPVEVVEAVPAEDVLSINTPAQLSEVDAMLRARMEAGIR